MAQVTKLELQQALAHRNAELQAARTRISVLEGELALLKSPKAAVTVLPGGATIERYGQRTVKRYPARN